MLGRDLVIYILENTDIFDKEFFKCFPTIESIATKFNVGTDTVEAWLENDYIECSELFGKTYILPNSIKDIAVVN